MQMLLKRVISKANAMFTPDIYICPVTTDFVGTISDFLTTCKRYFIKNIWFSVSVGKIHYRFPNIPFANIVIITDFCMTKQSDIKYSFDLANRS